MVVVRSLAGSWGVCRYKGGWLHVDLAGPAFLEERGTGYGVGLALALLGVEGFE